MLVSLRRFFFALGDQERLGGVGQCCDGARREVGLIRLALRGLILDRFAVVLALPWSVGLKAAVVGRIALRVGVRDCEAIAKVAVVSIPPERHPDRSRDPGRCGTCRRQSARRSTRTCCAGPADASRSGGRRDGRWPKGRRCYWPMRQWCRYVRSCVHPRPVRVIVHLSRRFPRSPPRCRLRLATEARPLECDQCLRRDSPLWPAAAGRCQVDGGDLAASDHGAGLVLSDPKSQAELGQGQAALDGGVSHAPPPADYWRSVLRPVYLLGQWD